MLDDLKTLDALLTHIHQSAPPKKAFIQSENRILRYGDVFDHAAHLCALFRDKGLKPGDRLVIITSDDLALSVFFIACLASGLTAVPLNAKGGEIEQNALIAAAKPKAILVDRDLMDALSVGDDVFVLPVDPGVTFASGGFLQGFLGRKQQRDETGYPGILSAIGNADFKPVTADPESTAYILFTSGTTSRPKGVEIPRRALLAQEKTFVRHYGLDEKSRILNILPLHHTDGLTHGVFMAFSAGATLFRPFDFRVDRLPELMDTLYRERIHVFMAVPAMLQLIDSLGTDHANDFKNGDLKFVVSTAGYLDPQLWQRFEKTFGVRVVNVYGLTETVCETIYCGPDDASRRVGTIGKCVDSQAKIVDDSGKECSPGQPGELWVKGDHIMTGYFEMPEETAAVLTDDKWLKTGDLAVCDNDGFYNIIGRKKNVIITGGMNIYPEDVANILRALPGVLDAVVFGQPDETWGEIAIAAVEAEPGASIDGHDLIAQMRNKTGPENIPHDVIVLESLPRGPAGKPILSKVKEMALAQKATMADSDVGAEDILHGVVAVAAETFRVDPQSLGRESTPENTKGWNSLAHVEFILALEKKFGIKMEPREIMAIHSVADAHDAIARRSQDKAGAG